MYMIFEKIRRNNHQQSTNVTKKEIHGVHPVRLLIEINKSSQATSQLSSTQVDVKSTESWTG